MKYIRLVSDIHLDFDIDMFNRFKSKLSPEKKALGEMGNLWLPTPMEEDKDTAFIIAGDIWVDHRFLSRTYQDDQSWLQKVANQFKYVVFVLGNHDYWQTNLSHEIKKIEELLQAQGLNNAFVLEKKSIVLDNVKFIGATFWTDYLEHNLELMYKAPDLMKDYKKIRFGDGYRKIRSSDLYKIHQESKSFIFSQAKKDNPEQKLVVVTHMAPSHKSLVEVQEDTSRDGFYASHLDENIAQSEIDYYFHGHIHQSVDYMIGKTRVMSNPRGYFGENKEKFQDNWRIEL